MTRFLLDTNVISEQRKGQRANAGVQRWFAEHRADDIWISVLVVGELMRGIELIRRRDQPAADRLETWLQLVLEHYSDHILSIDIDVVTAWAGLGVPDPIPIVDGLLAATALTHDLTLVTRNEADVIRTGAQIENPFSQR